jgi:superfamily II DNA/RNA helicase
MESFSRLGLAEPLAAALDSFGFASPTPVQTQAVPMILSRRDAIIESETGTGKTFAYLAPAFQLVSVLERRGVGEPGVIVAAPTQELAVQIGRESERLAKAAGLSLRTVVLLGGTALEKQAVKLKAKPEIVVGTLGRLADLVALGKLRTTSLKLLVLDEADRLFANETEELARSLLKSAPPSCTRVLVSATIPERIRRELRPLLRDAVEISPTGEAVLSGSIEHWCFYCDGRKRLDFARRFEAAVRPERCLVFLSMATRVEKAASALASLGLPVGAIHSGMDKETRRVALERFAAGTLRYLLTSDLGARGLDIPGITHILSLDLPEEPTIYTHRAGRTGRAGARGVSIVLADAVELARASKIATKGGFVFRCKVLEEGKVLEPTSEEFFSRAKAFEEQRTAAKASHVADGDRSDGGPRRRVIRSEPRQARRPVEAREVEGERTARKPRSAPWRESSTQSSPEPHSMLHKKSEKPREDRPKEATTRSDDPARRVPARNAPARDIPSRGAPPRGAMPKGEGRQDRRRGTGRDGFSHAGPAREGLPRRAPARDIPARGAPLRDGPAPSAPVRGGPPRDSPPRGIAGRAPRYGDRPRDKSPRGNTPSGGRTPSGRTPSGRTFGDRTLGNRTLGDRTFGKDPARPKRRPRP